MTRPIRVLVAKPGLDGHDLGTSTSDLVEFIRTWFAEKESQPT
jgi:methylmalonyl-CoA mutase cobalamin-binding subunit